jgi:2-dehydro-3-deoxyglucarate aldolase/4-hydroxy-2-oxoheptanedioate aldolase
VRENKVKRLLREGKTALGTMVMEFSTCGLAHLAAEAGADFLVYDLEHTGWSVETLRPLLASARSADVVPLVRVPATQYHFVARVLDLGALGVMVPMVESVEQARQIVQFAKYPPQGRRGTAFGIAHDDYRDGDVAAKIRSANQETLLIAQIETAPGLEQVEGIAAVEGLDVLWIGHFDLTTSLGIPGEFDHPRYREAVRRVLAACQRHGKAPGFMAASPEEGRALLGQGFRCLAYWGDLWIYKQALRQGLAALRAGLPS